MKLFERAAKLFGIVSVRQRGNLVYVSGLDAFVIKNHISRIWQTNIIAKSMFTSVSDTSFSIGAFFLPDLLYMLKQIREDETVGWFTRRTMDKIIAGILKDTWYASTIVEKKSIVDESRLKLLKWTPLPKQFEFLHVYGKKIPQYSLNGYLLAAAPGGGKTFNSLMVATCVISPKVAEVKIIISPKKALHLVWEKSVREVFKKPPTYWTSDNGTPIPLKGCEYYIFHYEKLDDAIKLAEHLKLTNTQYFTVVDESHNFADHRSERTKKLVKLQTTDRRTYFLWLSGSPILKHAAELASFLKCSDRYYDADADMRFRKIFTSAPGRAKEIFNNRLGEMMAFFVTKAEISSSKPIVKEIPVKLPPNLANRFLMSTVRKDMKDYIAERIKYYEPKMKEYREFVDKWLIHHERLLTTRDERRNFEKYRTSIKLISRNIDKVMTDEMAYAKKYETEKLFPDIPRDQRKIFRARLSAIKNIKMKVRGEALGTVLSKRRSECAAALAVYCKPENLLKQSLSKTLFFSSSVYPVKMLNEYLKKKGFSPLLVYGGTNTELTRMMYEFDHNPDVNPICATLQSLSEAVPVTSASMVVFINRPFRQAIGELVLDTGNEPNVSSTTDAILASVREDIALLIGPEFAGPDPDERIIEESVDASTSSDEAMHQDEELGLV